MSRTAAWIVLGGIVLACADPPPAVVPVSPPPAPSVADPLSITDDGAAFLGFYDRAKTEAPAARLARFEREIEPRFSAYWKYVRAGAERNGSTLGDRLNRQVDDFSAIESEYRTIAPTVRASLETSIVRFRERFPDFAPAVRIQILHGLGRMDGGTRVLDGQYYLLFGVDGIARYHRGLDLAPLFAHELFHVYYAQKHGEDGRSPKLVESAKEEAEGRTQPIYRELWDEGLAVYISEVLSPGATPASMMLDLPAGLVAACEEKRATLIDDLRQQLDARDPETYASFFLGSRNEPRRPARSGYYFGYLVAKSLAGRRPMNELIALDGDALRGEIDTTLAALKAP